MIKIRCFLWERNKNSSIRISLDEDGPLFWFPAKLIQDIKVIEKVAHPKPGIIEFRSSDKNFWKKYIGHKGIEE